MEKVHRKKKKAGQTLYLVSWVGESLTYGYLKTRSRMYLSWTNSRRVHPLNTPWDYTVELREFVRVQDHKIALLDINFELDPEWAQRELFVCVDICSGSLVGDTFMPVLRRVGRPEPSGFALPYYMDVGGDFINTTHIYITDEEGRTLSFSSQILTYTLHHTQQYHDERLPIFAIPARC